ncbi:MAG: flagellar biosynthesis anti-sigma factor FlgM [candidate division WS1 bacterium]|nr:flagellar biosynthesis anti-sigma factor FlgM [candidate division WS1 bacterium]
MRIDPSRLHNIGQRNVGRVGGADLEAARPVGETQATSPAGGVDQLALSSHVDEVKAARAALAEVPEVRAERVAELKAQVEAGTYRVDAERVADQILKGQG